MRADTAPHMLRWAYLPECEAPPEGWSVEPFRNVAKVIAGQSPPSDTYNEKRDGLPFLQGNGDFSFRSPVPTLWCSAPVKTARKGDTLISVRAPVGEVNRADRDYAIGRGLAAVRADGCDPDFLHHALQRWRWCLQRVAQGTTFDAVTARHFAQLRVAVPREPTEQAAIARILDAVDTALERTRTAVERARELRKTLIHELLGRGLRNEKRRRTAAGFLPASWACEPLGEHFQEGPTNGVYRPEADYASHGTRIVRIDDFADGKINSLQALRRVVVEPVVQRRFALAKDDVLINRVNSLSHIGKAALVPAIEEPTIFESNMMRLRCGPRLVPDFLIVVLCSDIARRHWLARAKPAVNQASVNQRDALELSLPLPETTEQREIASIVSAADRQIELLSQVIGARQRLKKSLMHDLLTGRVRVTNDMKAAAS